MFILIKNRTADRYKWHSMIEDTEQFRQFRVIHRIRLLFQNMGRSNFFLFFCFIICEYVHKRVGGPTFQLNQIYFFDAFTFVKWLGVELCIYKESDSEGLS